MRILEFSAESIQLAAEEIQNGNLVIVPTETVYGLAANGLDEVAVRRVFEAKGRPSENPVILHVASLEMAKSLVTDWPEPAGILAKRFWPGPLTMVLPRSSLVPDVISAGLPTAAIRMPAHSVALALMEAAGTPLAIPSANRFTKLSPTRAEHISPELAAHVSMILNGGPCVVGIESTVIDLSGETPAILRPGGVSKAMLEDALSMEIRSSGGVGEPKKSPGLYLKHYSPNAKVRLVPVAHAEAHALVFESRGIHHVLMPKEPSKYAAILYDCLHVLDQLGVEEVEVELPPESSEWEPILDRLRKASGAPSG